MEQEKIQLRFDRSHLNKKAILVDSSYPTTLDTVTFEVHLPVHLAEVLHKWMTVCESTGTLTSNINATDIIFMQALAGIINVLESS